MEDWDDCDYWEDLDDWEEREDCEILGVLRDSALIERFRTDLEIFMGIGTFWRIGRIGIIGRIWVFVRIGSIGTFWVVLYDCYYWEYLWFGRNVRIVRFCQD